MKSILSDVPCVGSEQVYPIDGRRYGQIPDEYLHPLPAPPGGQHEICGTESLRHPTREELLAAAFADGR